MYPLSCDYQLKSCTIIRGASVENIDLLQSDFWPFFDTIYQVMTDIASDAKLLYTNIYTFRLDQLRDANAIQYIDFLPNDKNAFKNLLLAFKHAGTRNGLVYACRAFFGENAQLITVSSSIYGTVDLTVNSAGTMYEFIEAGTDGSVTYDIVTSGNELVQVVQFDKINYNPAGLLENFLPTGFKVGSLTFTYDDIDSITAINNDVLAINNDVLVITDKL